MLSICTKAVSLLALVASGAFAQIDYLPNATVTWTRSVAPVLEGNGAYTSPDGALAVVVSRDSSVSAFSTGDGMPIWSVPAPTTTAQSFGGASFCYGAATPYVIYSYVDANVSTAVAIDTGSGQVAVRFGPMLGTVAGTPVTTQDCDYVLATHNVDGAKGYFSVFSYTTPGTPVVAYEHPSIDNEPFGAVGYYWSPVEGYFPGGESNTNDVFIWSFDTNLNINNSTVGTSQFFGFQFPANPMSAANVTLIDGTRDYQAKTAPLITDGGLSMYWSVSRSKVYGWVGDGSGRLDFTTNGVGNYEFDRDTTPFSSSALTTPSISNSTGPDGFVVGTGAANEIWRVDRNFSVVAPIIVPTAGLITSRLLVSPDDTFVYFATPDPDASLYRMSSDDLSESWKLPLTGGVAGDIAQTKNGARIIVADVDGFVTAYTVATAAEDLTPISAPPVAPTVPTATGTAPPVSSGPSATSGPSSTMGPSISAAPVIPGAPTASSVPIDPSIPIPPTAPTAPTPPVSAPVRTPSAPTDDTEPSAPASDAIAFSNLFVSLFVIATTAIVMSA